MTALECNAKKLFLFVLMAMGIFVFTPGRANAEVELSAGETVYVSIYGNYTVHAIDDPSGEALPGEMERRVAEIFAE